jgi:hypothetical protein
MKSSLACSVLVEDIAFTLAVHASMDHALNWEMVVLQRIPVLRHAVVLMQQRSKCFHARGGSIINS